MGTKKLLQFPATAKYSFQAYFGLIVDSAGATGTP